MFSNDRKIDYLIWFLIPAISFTLQLSKLSFKAVGILLLLSLFTCVIMGKLTNLIFKSNKNK